MVDPIGTKAVTVPGPRLSGVGAAVKAAPVAGDHAAETNAATAIEVAHNLAARPPVDSEKVARLRSAIAGGRYRIDPETIADRLIALKQEWTA